MPDLKCKTETERDRRVKKWIETGDQRWLNRDLSVSPRDAEERKDS